MTIKLLHRSFTEQLHWVQKRINKILLNKFYYLPHKKSKLIAAMKYSTLSGGKRLRPFLIYTIGNILHMPLKILDSIAAAIECIHTYSLIHDDLPAMDNSLYRRGQHTCHISFTEAHAILAGDALQSLAFNILSNSNMPNVNDNNKLIMISELSNAIGVAGMCSGQALDMESINKKIKINDLQYIYHHKTSSLIRAAIKICIIASGNKNHTMITLLDTYAKTIGLLLQINDDLNDIKEDKKFLKKHNTCNIIKKNKTYPFLIGINNTNKEIIKLHKKALNILNLLEKKHKINIKILQNLVHFIIKQKILKKSITR